MSIQIDKLTPAEYDLVSKYPTFVQQQMPELYKKAMIPVTFKNFKDGSGYPVDPHQAASHYGFSGVGTMQKHDIFGAGTHDVPPRVVDRAFMQDCQLEDPVINSVLVPHQSFFSSIPVMQPPDNYGDTKFSFVTQHTVADPADNYPDEPCDEPGKPDGTVELCKFLFPYGHTPLSTRTAQIHELITQACSGRYDDFFFVGELGYSNTRGTSDTPPFKLTVNDRDFIIEAAMRRELAEMGLSMELRWGTEVWTGDPANNTVGGGGKFFWGMENFIRTDWDVTGDFAGFLESSTGAQADCSTLNSVVANYNNTMGDGTLSTYRTFQSVEQSLFSRSMYYRLDPVQWAIVMHPTVWDTLIQIWPCEYMADSCPPTSGAQLVTNDELQQQLRNTMRQTQRMTINGREYPVILDDYMTVTEAAGAGGTFDYTSSAFFIPYTVRNGQSVLHMQHYDFTLSSDPFSRRMGDLPLLEGLNLSAVWTDGGRYLLTLLQRAYCLEIETLAKLRMVFLAPHLAGRIDNITANYTVRYDLPQGLPNSNLL